MMSTCFRTTARLHSTYLLALLMLILLTTSATAQPRANLFFTTTINQPADGQLSVRFFMQADQEDFKLGSASFVFDFNTAGLSFPSSFNAQAGIDYTFSSPFTTFPFNSLVTQPTTGKVQVEVTYAYSFRGACAGASATTGASVEVAEVIFTIDDPSQTADLSWDASLTRVFDDGTIESPPCDDTNNVQATEIALGTLLGDDAFLPVELVSFQAQADGADALLQWETASETNNSGFEIEQRAVGAGADAPWQTRAFIEGAGTTEEQQSYTYRFTGLEPGTHTFRLKQIDYDGTFEYSPQVEVVVDVAGLYHLSGAYPNPFNSQTQFSLAVPVAQEVTIEVYDVLGRRVVVLYQGELQANQSRAFVWEAASHPSGLYIIRMVGERFSETQRVMLQK